MADNQQNTERKARVIALIGTVICMLLVWVALLFMAFRTPLPLPSEQGVEVNLGYSDDGMGDIQPEVPAASQASPPQQAAKPDDEMVSENTDENPAIKNQNKKPAPQMPITSNNQAKQPDVNPQPAVNPNALYKGKGTGNVAGGNQGITGKPGDQGSPNGTPGSPNYIGSGGTGTSGVSHDLGGRGARSLPKPSYNSNEQGKIVVAIKVNREGKVTYAAAGARGTTISEISLRKQAEAAALRAIFAPDANAPDEQRGTITYIFQKVM